MLELLCSAVEESPCSFFLFISSAAVKKHSKNLIFIKKKSKYSNHNQIEIKLKSKPKNKQEEQRKQIPFFNSAAIEEALIIQKLL